MPAERTKSWSHHSPSHQLVWTAPVAAAPCPELIIESTAHITELDFDDGPPPLVDAPPYGFPTPPTEFILFPPADDKSAAAPTPKRASPHSKKKPENHIPRPPNAFILFRSSFIKGQHVSQDVETNHSTLSKIIGITWKNLSETERQTWHAKAKREGEEHRRRFPKYAFKPQQAKGKGGTAGPKRKVREVEPKDLTRCAKIAELLGKGMKGSELKAEIAEFDKHHVPEIVTRFEAPITERAFRRSSSAPVPDTELAIEQQSFLPKEKTPAQPRKLRSASARPTRCPTPQVDFTQQQQQPQQQHQFSSPPTYMDSSLKQETNFDFSTFSFDTVIATSPGPNFACDPLIDAFAHTHTSIPSSFTHTDADLGLSIDTTTTTTTSFMNSEWSSECSSPVSPSSDFLSTPSPSPSFPCASPAADLFGHAFEKSFGDYTALHHNPLQHQQHGFPAYEEPSVNALCADAFLGMGGEDYATFVNLPSGFDQFSMDAFASTFASPVSQYAF